MPCEQRSPQEAGAPAWLKWILSCAGADPLVGFDEGRELWEKDEQRRLHWVQVCECERYRFFNSDFFLSMKATENFFLKYFVLIKK